MVNKFDKILPHEQHNDYQNFEYFEYQNFQYKIYIFFVIVAKPSIVLTHSLF